MCIHVVRLILQYKLAVVTAITVASAAFMATINFTGPPIHSSLAPLQQIFATKQSVIPPLSLSPLCVSRLPAFILLFSINFNLLFLHFINFRWIFVVVAVVAGERFYSTTEISIWQEEGRKINYMRSLLPNCTGHQVQADTWSRPNRWPLAPRLARVHILQYLGN